MANTVPSGYTGQAALAMVRLRTDEPTYPSDANLLTLLNAAVEQVAASLGPIRLQKPYPVIANQTVVALANDVQDIISASFSTGDPSAAGVMVYPMYQYEQAQFMDLAAGFPGTGSGPPQYYLITSDQNNAMTMQVYPPAMAGQINLYYRARPFIWGDASSGSSSNIDSMAQEAVILWTCARALEARGRGDEAKTIFTPQYDAKIAELKETIARRVAPKSGQVRDVMSMSWPGRPPWYRR